MNYIQNKEYKNIDKSIRYFEEFKENMADDALLLLNEDEINETFAIPNEIKTGIHEGNQKFVNRAWTM